MNSTNNNNTWDLLLIKIYYTIGGNKISLEGLAPKNALGLT